MEREKGQKRKMAWPYFAPQHDVFCLQLLHGKSFKVYGDGVMFFKHGRCAYGTMLYQVIAKVIFPTHGQSHM